MWPFRERLWKRIGELEARVNALEYQSATDRLQLLDVLDTVTYRMTERERKRRPPEEPEQPQQLQLVEEHALGAERRFGRS